MAKKPKPQPTEPVQSESVEEIVESPVEEPSEDQTEQTEEEEGFLDESDLAPQPEIQGNTEELGTSVYFEVRWPNPDGGSGSIRFGGNIESARQTVVNRRNQGQPAILVLVSTLEIPV